MLEVSSPGIERRIRTSEHLQQNIGNKIKVNTYKNLDELKIKEVFGNLKSYSTENIVVEIDDKKEVEIEMANISKITTVFDW